MENLESSQRTQIQRLDPKFIPRNLDPRLGIISQTQDSDHKYSIWKMDSDLRSTRINCKTNCCVSSNSMVFMLAQFSLIIVPRNTVTQREHLENNLSQTLARKIFFFSTLPMIHKGIYCAQTYMKRPRIIMDLALE